MKTLDLNAYGVQEMNAAEMRETDGGIIIPALALYAAGASIICCATTLAAYYGYKMNQ
ncbi:MAG: hypothetical protein ACK5L7_03565 [Paludibacteraceae bacterium]